MVTKEYLLEQSAVRGENTSNVSIKLKTDSHDPKTKFLMVIKEITEALKEDPVKPCKIFNADSIPTITNSNLDILTSFTQFDVGSLLDFAANLSYSPNSILDSLKSVSGSGSDILTYISQNLILTKESISLLFFFIIDCIADGDYLIKLLARTNPQVSEFIKNGLNDDIIYSLTLFNHKSDLNSIIERGLMVNKIDLYSSKRILKAFPSSSPKFLKNIRIGLGMLDLEGISKMTNELIKFIFYCDPKTDSKLKSVISMIKHFPWSGVQEILEMDAIIKFISKSSLINQDIFVKKVEKIIMNRDLTANTKFAAFKCIISSYPSYTTRKLFTSIRDFLLNKSDFDSRMEVSSLITCIVKRSDLCHDDKMFFFEEIISTYPSTLIETLFILIKDFIGRESHPKSILGLIFLLIRRQDLSEDEKTRIMIVITKYYYSENIARMINLEYWFIYGLATSSEFLLEMVLIVSLRKDLNRDDYDNIFSEFKRSYDKVLMERIIAKVKSHVYSRVDPQINQHLIKLILG